MKSIMKKLLIIISALVLFTSCSNLLDGANKKSESSEKTVTVKGRLSTEVNARTAFVSFAGITWQVQAYNDKSSKTAEVDGSAFSIALPPGEWNLSAIGTDSTGLVLAAGITKITVNENEPQKNVIIKTVKAHGQGNIALKVCDKTEQAAKLVCSYKYLLGGNEVSAPDFTTAFTDGVATITFENVYTGDAEISIYNAENSKIFSCSEKINVLYDLTTDVFADCEYVTDGVLTITDEVVNAYAASQMDYPLVLWNRTDSDYGKKYRQGANVFAAADSETIITESIFSARSNYWCFGDNKSIYVATIKTDPDGFYVEKCVPKQNAYAASYEKVSAPVINYTKTDETYVRRITSIAWSSFNEKSYLYVLYGTSYYPDAGNSAKLRVFDVTDWDGTETVTAPLCLKDFSASGSDPLINDDFNNAFMTVSGDDIYIVRRATGLLEVRPYKFTITDTGEVDEQNNPVYNYDVVYQDNPIDVYTTLSTTNYQGLGNLSVTDMTIVDNYLIILVCSSSNYKVPTGTHLNTTGVHANEYNFTKSEVSGSAGGILRYNLSDCKFERWQNGSLIFGCYTSEMEIYENPGEEYFDTEPDKYIANIITNPPAQLDANYFYGPRKIIARKPDELVIADDGYEWIDDNTFGEKNRIIKLNLKKWAITAVEDAGVMFDGFACDTLNGCPGFDFKIQ